MELFSSFTPSSFDFQMPLLAITIMTLGTLYVLGFVSFNLNPWKKLPQGSSFIGDFIGFHTAMKAGKNGEWIRSRIRKYGPVFKSCVMDSHIAILTGQSGNKFILTTSDGIASDDAPAMTTILGRKSLIGVEGSRHKLLKGAVMNMLKPERLQKFVGEMDSSIQRLLLQELEGKDSVNLVSLSRRVIFAVTCTTVLGLPEDTVGENSLRLEDLLVTSQGLIALPFNIPGMLFAKACKARAKICKVIYNIIMARKLKMEEEKTGSQDDIVASFINVRDEEGKPLSDEEIVDNLLTLLIASNDTTSSLLSMFLRHLGNDAHVYNQVFEEQKEVAKAREGSPVDGKLIWNETQSMKYSWRVAQEIMRFSPPAVGNFRIATKDMKYGEFDIPKGWRMLWVASPTHNDPDIFEEPEKFNPSRFEGPSIAPFTYVPFGGGVRICPGNGFARTTVLLVIHHLLTNYRWTPKIHDEPISTNPVPFPAMGLPVKLHPIVDKFSS
ncbi:hypothetical protein GIB67_004096 [Kingdonia uniflora]|uniref:Cytochrome P450 n=1 Tax=Kingdonia uniflora TaxID=39325 RepID=A0A7J7NRV5_9MAGN|nr:hypothetical protein GIB67_004096 [Kingdonia uniflora]